MRRILAVLALTASVACASASEKSPFINGVATMPRRAGLEYLAQLAADGEPEELLAYVPQTGQWHDLSAERLPGRVIPIDIVLYQLCNAYEDVEVYHTHAFHEGLFTYEGGVRYGIWDPSVARTLDWAIHGYPSGGDGPDELGNDYVASIQQGYALCAGRRISFGVVSQERQTASAGQAVPFTVVRWAPDGDRFTWPKDADGTLVQTMEELTTQTRNASRAYDDIVIQGVLARKSRAEILREASDATAVRFWEERWEGEKVQKPRQDPNDPR